MESDDAATVCFRFIAWVAVLFKGRFVLYKQKRESFVVLRILIIVRKMSLILRA